MQWGNQAFNKFTYAFLAFYTAIYLRFCNWFTNNRDVFASHTNSLGYIWG